MKIERIDHLHFVVNDISKFQKIFTKLLGLEFTPVEEFPNVRASASISTEPVEFALVKPNSADHALAKFIQKRGEGLYSFCLKISDFDEVIADFNARGIKYHILPERKRFDKTVKIVQIDPREAHGVRIELTEY